MFCCLDVQLYHLCGKSRFVCAHIRQNRNIYPPSIFCLYFWLVPLPLLRRLTVGAAIEKNFFWFYFSDSLVILRCLDWEIFFIFSDFRLVYPILGFQLNSFTEYPRFNSFIFARYYLDYDFWLRFWFSTRFYSLNFTRIDFDLFQHCLFYSSACYKQTFMLLWVCFMLVLAILRLSDVFSFVLGVVYRLGLK